MDKLDADSSGKPVAYMPPPPRFIPVPGPPPPGLATAVRGLPRRAGRTECTLDQIRATAWSAYLGMPAWHSPVDRNVENPNLDHRKPPKKSESGVDSKHGCCRNMQDSRLLGRHIAQNAKSTEHIRAIRSKV